jgi:hypothetical protein
MKVIVVSQKLNKAGKIENFVGTTFQDLLNASTDNGINVSDLYNRDEVEVVVNPGNISIRGVDSLLPQQDIKVFFTIKKNKAGMEATDINKLSQEVKELVKTAQKQSSVEQKTALKQVISEAINNFYRVAPAVVNNALTIDVVEDPELQDALNELKQL